MRRSWCLVWMWAAACQCGGRDGSLYNPDPPITPEVVVPPVAPAEIAPPIVAAPMVGRVEISPPIVHGPHQVDTFTQDQALVDVLWIVDNSASLSNERMRLATQFQRFINTLTRSNVDYHVGVTSTDLDSSRADQGRLRGMPRWIDRATPNPRDVFAAAVDFPNDLDIRLEEGLAAMVRALTPPLSENENRGFLRPEAALAVIVVSDEDDGSLAHAAQYTRFLRSFRGPGREANVSLSAVVGPQPDGCVTPGEEHIFGAKAEAGDRYLEVARATNGEVESICAADFGPFVDALAISLSGLRRFFPVSAPADQTSIVVRVNGRVIRQDAMRGWTYRESPRGIVFSGSYVPPPGAEVRVEYDVAI